jgi:4-amino-4-deoxy-L-arabinose transferase-like glycosyltransferase
VGENGLSQREVESSKGLVGQSPAAIDLAPASSEHRRFLFAVLVLVIVGLWLIPARKSLWIDETGTYWVIKDGLSQTWHRAITFQGQSPFFYLIEWIAKWVFGRSEIGLRLPSLISSAVSVLLLFRLTKRLIGQEAAWIASVIFACLTTVAMEARDARPYAFALMLLLACTLTLVRWMDRGKLSYGGAYVLLVAATIYAHYLFALPILAHVVYFLYRRHDSEIRARAYVASLACAAALAIPSFAQLKSLLDRRQSLVIPTSLSVRDFIDVLAPSAIVIGILGGWLIARSIEKRSSLAPANANSWDRALVGAWWAIPPVTLYFISVSTGTALFQARYYLSAAPALTLIAAWMISRLSPERARRIVVVAVVLLSVLVLPDRIATRDEGWRSALNDANMLSTSAQTPVLIRTALAEARQPNSSDPERLSYLLSPISFYPIKGRAFALPLYLNPSSRAYLNQLASNVLIHSDRFIVVSRESDPLEPWFEGKMEPFGFQPTYARNYGNLYLTMFERNANPTGS